MASGGDRLVVITWNVGDHGTKDDLKGMLDRGDVLTLQEMGDRDPFYDLLHDKGWKTYDAGGDNGRHSTPIAWDPHSMGAPKDKYCKQLSPKTHAPGTGPDDVKPKWLIGCGWDGHAGRYSYDHEIRIGCLHLVSDSGKDNKKRHELAQDEINVAKNMWHGNNGYPKGFCDIAGDWNTSWNNDLVKPMKDKGWTAAQGCKGGPNCTHGSSWTPDQQWFRNGHVYNQGIIETKSDHDAYWVSFQL